MKLSISNIAWSKEHDEAIYSLMKRDNYEGLEIAPTRIFPSLPYEKKEEVLSWGREIQKQGISVSSMQSIWYGREEKIFGTEQERKKLIDYTKAAIEFASILGCKNLVFGCPRNRFVPIGIDPVLAIPFFKELGDYAVEFGTVIGMEANPTIYHTNYINDTASAIELIKQVDSKGFKLNLDIGTMIYNKEPVDLISEHVALINHVHISEPGLGPIEERTLHKELKEVLEQEGYSGFVSIEMGKVDDISKIENTMGYVRSVFA